MPDVPFYCICHAMKTVIVIALFAETRNTFDHLSPSNRLIFKSFINSENNHFTTEQFQFCQRYVKTWKQFTGHNAGRSGTQKKTTYR